MSQEAKRVEQFIRERTYTSSADDEGRGWLSAALVAAREEGRREGFEKAREMLTPVVEELEDVASTLHLQTEHKSNPGSTQGILVQQGSRVAKVAHRIRAMRDEAGESKPAPSLTPLDAPMPRGCGGCAHRIHAPGMCLAERGTCDCRWAP